jgi:hypothetical protein
MTQATVSDRDIIRIARLLDQAGEYNRRAKLCPRQHARGLYRRKDAILEEVLTEAPEQFEIDSILQDEPLILGISHVHTARRFHLRPDRLASGIRKMIDRLPRRNGTNSRKEDHNEYTHK